MEAKPLKRQRAAKFIADLLAVAVGIGTEFTFHFIGDLYVAEILLILALVPLLMLRGRRLLRRDLGMVYALMGLWLLGLIIADAYNETSIVDRMRGTALIVFFALDLASLSILVGRNEKRKLLYLVGFTIGSLAFVKLQPNEATADYPWKFGYALGTMMLALLLGSYFYNRRKYAVSALFIVAVCGLNLIFNYRSPLLDLLITLVLVYPIVPERMGRLQILPASPTLRILVLLVLTLGAAATANSLVHLVTQLGYINEDAQAKNEAQSNAGNLLMGGRPEFVIGLRAAMDSPIIGHGSWAKDPKYYEMFYDEQVESGEMEPQVGGDILSEHDALIPAHSGIVNAWIWAGILGLIFWIYVTWLVMKGIVSFAVTRPPFAPIYTWLLISMFWDIFFSPFAASRRITGAFLLLVIADLNEKTKAVSLSKLRISGVGMMGNVGRQISAMRPANRSGRTVVSRSRRSS